MNIQRTLIAAALAVVAASASAQGFPGGPGGGPGGPGGPGGQGRMMRGGFGGPMGGGLMTADMLVMRQDVQEDLKLTEEQKAKLDELRQTMRPRRGPGGPGGGQGGPGGFGGPGGGPGGPGGGPGGQGGPGGPGGDPEQMRKQFEEMRKKNTDAVLKILTLAQQTRIKEIAIQLAGNSAILDAEVQKALGLNEGQKTKAKNLVQRQGEANRAVFEKAREGEIEQNAVMTIVKRNDDALKDELGKLLTADQAARLKTLAGKPFEAQEPNRG